MAAKNGTPVLAGVIGEYREFRPAAVLQPHFQCTWSNALPPDGGNRLAVVPDGCIDITWIDGELVVAGPDVAVAISSFLPGGMVTGARFRPGAARQWLGVPMSEITGSRIPLEAFWGVRARQITQRIGDASPAARVRVMEAAFSTLAAGFEPPSPEFAFVFGALGTASAGTGMNVVLEQLHVSPRTLRRRCHEAFGYGPKTLDRILRFQRFLRLTHQTMQPRLAALAFEAGYADQAHLTREVKCLSGFSPLAILSQTGT